ncbi:AAA family ATPase [Actinophytocola sp.]|uniref:AAA family ATPase n=1 Tax=Actinophytocola sp. TaxID=1872138 RepID=UPI002ED15114
MTIFCTAGDPPGPLAAALGAGVHVVTDLSEVDTALAARPGESLVVLGPGVSLREASDFAAAYRLRRPALGVVLVRHAPGIEDYSQALRSGIREVVDAADPVALTEACARSRALSESAQVAPAGTQAGKVVTVFSSKGGCGKTTLATNLAVTLHAGGRRVCLVDLDLAFGDVAISLRLEPKRTLIDAVGMGEDLDETGVAGLLTRFRPGLDCVLAPVEPGDAERVPASLVTDLLTVLRGMFDYVVIDTPPQFNEHVLKALDGADHHVLVTTPDMPTLKNLRLTIEMLDVLSYPRDIRAIVLNREDPRTGMTAADVEHVLKTPVAARIPASLEVTASVNRGVPIAAEQPSHKVSAAIREFGDRRLAGKGAQERPRRGLFALQRRRSRHEAQ